MEGALCSLPGEEPLIHDGRAVLPQDHAVTVPHPRGWIPQDAETGFISVTDNQLLDGSWGWRTTECQTLRVLVCSSLF